MQSINFDDGYKSYMINNDENKIIRINVTDLNTSKRFEDAVSAIDKLMDEVKGEGDISEERFIEADRVIREQLDHVFGDGMCEIVFGKTNVLSATESGKLLIEGFLDALLPVVKADMEAAAAKSRANIEKKMAAYIEPVISNDNELPDISSLTDEQKQALLAELSK